VWPKNGKTELSDTFAIRRGTLQGDIVNPYGFLLALSSIFYKHDSEANEAIGIKLKHGTHITQLLYADDALLVCKDNEEASTWLTTIAKGSREDVDMEVAVAKTKTLSI
jgi:hypothetical protein